MMTRISSKGQITIPAEIRQKASLKTGDIMNVKTGEEGTVILIPCARQRKNEKEPGEIIRQTAGIWSSMEESGEEYVDRIRIMEDARWKVLEDG